MINLFELDRSTAATDLAAAKMALAAVMWSYNDTKFVGAAFARPASVPVPESEQAREIMRTSIAGGRTCYLLTGNITLADESVKPCLVLAGNIGSLTERIAANLDRLATILGYTAVVDGVTTPLWVGAGGTYVAETGTDSALSIRMFNISGVFTALGGAYASYVPIDGFTIAQNHTFTAPTYESRAYAVSDSVCIWHYANDRTNYYMTEKQYITDMQNMQDLANYIVNAMGNPSETTELTARVTAIEDSLSSEVPAPVASAIVSAVDAEANAREAADAGIASAIGKLPVLGAKLVDVASAATIVNQYIPRP